MKKVNAWVRQECGAGEEGSCWDDERRVRVVRLRLTRNEAAQYRGRSGRRKLLRMAVEGGIVARPGWCGCRVCSADGDCCGNYVPGYIESRKAGRDVHLIQVYSRNC